MYIYPEADNALEELALIVAKLPYRTLVDVAAGLRDSGSIVETKAGMFTSDYDLVSAEGFAALISNWAEGVKLYVQQQAEQKAKVKKLETKQ